MDVSADNDRCPDWDDIGFLSQDFLGLSVVVVTFSQSALISASGRGLQVSISAICLSILL